MVGAGAWVVYLLDTRGCRCFLGYLGCFVRRRYALASNYVRSMYVGFVRRGFDGLFSGRSFVPMKLARYKSQLSGSIFGGSIVFGGQHLTFRRTCMSICVWFTRWGVSMLHS